MDVLNDILAALSLGIKTLLPDIPIYSEWVPDELPCECFLIGFAGEVNIGKAVSGRMVVSGQLDIVYLPPRKETELQARKKMNHIFSLLSLQLRVLRYKGVTIRLDQHTRRGADDELHDICRFETYLYESVESPVMGDIDVNERNLDV